MRVAQRIGFMGVALIVASAAKQSQCDNCTQIDTEASCCEFTFTDVGVGLACQHWSCPHVVSVDGTFARPTTGPDGFQKAALTGTRGVCQYYVATSCGTAQNPCVYSQSVTTASCSNWVGAGDACSR